MSYVCIHFFLSAKRGTISFTFVPVHVRQSENFASRDRLGGTVPRKFPLVFDTQVDLNGGYVRALGLTPVFFDGVYLHRHLSSDQSRVSQFTGFTTESPLVSRPAFLKEASARVTGVAYFRQHRGPVHVHHNLLVDFSSCLPRTLIIPVWGHHFIVPFLPEGRACIRLYS